MRCAESFDRGERESAAIAEGNHGRHEKPEIAQAIADCDPQAAEEAMRTHILRALERFSASTADASPGRESADAAPGRESADARSHVLGAGACQPDGGS